MESDHTPLSYQESLAKPDRALRDVLLPLWVRMESDHPPLSYLPAAPVLCALMESNHAPLSYQESVLPMN